VSFAAMMAIQGERWSYVLKIYKFSRCTAYVLVAWALHS